MKPWIGIAAALYALHLHFIEIPPLVPTLLDTSSDEYDSDAPAFVRRLRRVDDEEDNV